MSRRGLVRIAHLICDQPSLPDDLMNAMMRMAMYPNGWRVSLDELFQVGNESAGQIIVPKFCVRTQERRCVVTNHDGRTILFGGELCLQPRSSAFMTLKSICRREAVWTIDQSMIIQESSRLIHRVRTVTASKSQVVSPERGA